MLVDTWQTNLLMCLKLIIGYDIDSGLINWSKNYLWLSGVWCPSPTPYGIYKRQTLYPYVKCWVCLATFLFENGFNTNILNFNSLSLVELQLWVPRLMNTTMFTNLMSLLNASCYGSIFLFFFFLFFVFLYKIKIIL